MVVKRYFCIKMFNGRLKITVIQAKGLQHTNFMTRHNMAVTMDPYVSIVVDDVSIERTSTKGKTHEPTWNETFTTDLLRNAEEVGFTVFHDATIPPDDFVAESKISLSDLIEKEDQPVHDLWVSSSYPLPKLGLESTAQIRSSALSINSSFKNGFIYNFVEM